MTTAVTEKTSTIEVGEKAPSFTLPTDGNGSITLSELRGKKVVIYFYPKDNTPGCTQESKDFRDAVEAFTSANTTIIGMSKDSVASHDKFKTKYDLPFLLASDESGDILEAYGVWKEKSMYGKKFMGIERTTVLIDESGTITKIWPKVKVNGHVDEVLREVSN